MEEVEGVPISPSQADNIGNFANFAREPRQCEHWEHSRALKVTKRASHPETFENLSRGRMFDARRDAVDK